MNGNIEVKSKLDEGSTFTVVIPIKMHDVTFFISKWQNEHPNIRILVGRDKKTTSDIIYSQFGAQLVKKVESKDIINELLMGSQENKPFHILIIDDEITTIDPIEFIKLIPHIKTILQPMTLLSTFSRNKEWFDRARDAGFYDFIIKPLLPSELDEKISLCWDKWIQTQY